MSARSMPSCWAGWKALARQRPASWPRLHLPNGSLEASLLRLENQGQVLRGRFRPRRPNLRSPNLRSQAGSPRLRRLGGVIAACLPGSTAVPSADCAGNRTRRHRRLHAVSLSMAACGTGFPPGEAGLLEVVRQLTGFEAAASSWDLQLLRVRMGK